jgi:ArsR family transcriptional regulator, arsenate/arsenite/antimonite-responsive transcriptional repressor
VAARLPHRTGRSRSGRHNRRPAPRITSAPEGEICVCDLTGGDFDVSGPTISHHLKVLREAGLIDGERRGTWVYYRPQPHNLRQLAALLDAPVASSA